MNAKIKKINAEYEKKQEMRAMERDIRDAKTHLLAFDAARSKEGFNTWALKLNERREKYREYCINNGLDERADRLQVYGFGRSIARAAAHVDRKKL